MNEVVMDEMMLCVRFAFEITPGLRKEMQGREETRFAMQEPE